MCIRDRVEELLQIGLGLFGGLALFLYGMNLMSNNSAASLATW